MNSGDLRESVGIYLKTTTQNENGYTEDTLTNVDTVAAGISSVSGKDFYAAMAAGALDVITIKIRWYPGLTTAHVVSWDGGFYEILEINYLGARRDFMILKCQAVKGSAGH